MPLHFWWKPNNSPIGTSDNRKDIGLELGGDDTSVTDGAAGRIELTEVGGSGSDKGAAESDVPRLIATFHGKFHRDSKADLDSRLTFEIDTGKSGTVAFSFAEVQGYDPECLLGVDAFVFTFLNREFQVNFPFFLDTRSEGTFVELQATAFLGEGKGSTELGHSAALNMRIRRKHQVETTSKDPAGNNIRYTGGVVGNLILHHEDYLVSGAVRMPSASWPATVSSQPIPVPWSGAGKIPFQTYNAGDLLVVLMTDLLDGLFSADKSPPAAARTQARNRVASTLSDIFTDAGFQGKFIWEDDPAASALVTSFRGAFSRSNDQWSLKSGHTTFSIPFWQFVIARDTGISAVGVFSEVSGTEVTAGGRVYLLSYPSPIGSGNRTIDFPLRIRSDYFSPVDKQVNSKSSKMAIVIAHEIGHAIGLMHECLIADTGPYDESNASPLMTIMASSVENSSYGVDMKFSNQAKVIWNKAFGVTPVWTNAYLKNKTWGNDWATVDWSERKNRFFKLNEDNGMISVGLTHYPNPVPYQGTGKKLQRGTFQP